jgi:hypothetical protein
MKITLILVLLTLITTLSESQSIKNKRVEVKVVNGKYEGTLKYFDENDRIIGTQCWLHGHIFGDFYIYDSTSTCICHILFKNNQVFMIKNDQFDLFNYDDCDCIRSFYDLDYFKLTKNQVFIEVDTPIHLNSQVHFHIFNYPDYFVHVQTNNGGYFKTKSNEWFATPTKQDRNLVLRVFEPFSHSKGIYYQISESNFDIVKN